MPRIVRQFAWVFLGILPLSVVAEDKPPLRDRIDRLIEQKAAGPVPPLASDAEFLRRVYLDLTGVIPTASEARAFLADKSPDKRAKLIDRLLKAPEYARRMREMFNVMLMERMGTSEDWNKYLEASFGKNKPWDRLTREILLGEEGKDQSLRGVPFFYTKRLEKYGQNPTDRDGLARDIGRLFLGMDLQCANCHSHLFIKDYKQRDYQGLFAFIMGTNLVQIDGRPGLSEALMTKKREYVSVFEDGSMSTGPRLPGGEEFEIPQFKRGEEYLVPPDRRKRITGVPKFSPRRILSERLPRPDNHAFKRNIANRLWWAMMGRGLVEPLDLHHSDNPPSHPDLLKLLSEEFAAKRFDIKAFLRELALTRTYQRSSVLPDIKKLPRETFLVANEKGISAEQLARSVWRATGNDKASASKFEEAMAAFLTAFANPRREPEVEFRSSVKAALFMSNSDLVVGWLEPKDGNLTDRLAKMTDAKQLADELYLTVLTRFPSEEERNSVEAYLKKRSDNRAQAVKNLTWALLASTEFCVNH